MLKSILAISLALATAPASAAQAIDDGWCRNGAFPKDQSTFGLARIAGKGRAHFLDDMDGCPNTEARCRSGTYVIPGDLVLTGRTRGEYVCTYFPNRVGGSAGWMSKARLRPVPVNQAPPLASWAGNWADGDNSVRISRRGNRLQLEGDAYWPSASPSLEERPGGPNVGNIGGWIRPRRNRATYDDEGCQVSLTLVGHLLLAADNNECGGMNVSFTGVYRRK